MIDVNEILPNLFIGSNPRSFADIIGLRREFRITAVLNVQTDEEMARNFINRHGLESHYCQADIEVREVPVRDFDPGDLRLHLPECVKVLDELLHRGHTVYVHCNMGVNRSPSIVIAYLHWVEGWDLEKATAHVLRYRSCEPYVNVIRLAVAL